MREDVIMAGEQSTSTITVVDVYNAHDHREYLIRNMHCFWSEVHSMKKAVELALTQGCITAFSWYWDADCVFVVTAGIEPHPSNIIPLEKHNAQVFSRGPMPLENFV